MTSARRLDGYTLEDWERLEPAEGHRVELVDGRFVVSAAPAVAHQRVADRLCRLLDDAVADGGMEAVTAVGVRVAPGLGYIPDVVVCTELVETTAVEVALVALAVEVVSPSTARRDRLEKPAAFAAAGVPAFWRVEVGREGGPVIYCYRLDQGVYVETVTLQGGATGTVDVPGGGTVTFDPADLIGSRRPRS
ncbi:Uma2 family endonuclease [Saccharothrix longispora]|uniref:Uma2 family endonuclease n=1 Tax=Saccharothrix longispora TaxID=33920 RepID=A0ABU1Q2V3_9PSEU|nr:Uma2 family endonuclease [Saccharothrix longispora]MDR6597237.1 Uma2 family endonuclease [Saccharothrix longispora]